MTYSVWVPINIKTQTMYLSCVSNTKEAAIKMYEDYSSGIWSDNMIVVEFTPRYRV